MGRLDFKKHVKLTRMSNMKKRATHHFKLIKLDKLGSDSGTDEEEKDHKSSRKEGEQYRLLNIVSFMVEL